MQAGQGEAVSVSVKNAKGYEFSFSTIGHGRRFGRRGGGMSQADNPFSSFPPMRGGVMQHSFDEHHLSQDAVMPARCDAHRDNVLSHSQLPESRFPCDALLSRRAVPMGMCTLPCRLQLLT